MKYDQDGKCTFHRKSITSKNMFSHQKWWETAGGEMNYIFTACPPLQRWQVADFHEQICVQDNLAKRMKTIRYFLNVTHSDLTVSLQLKDTLSFWGPGLSATCTIPHRPAEQFEAICNSPQSKVKGIMANLLIITILLFRPQLGCISQPKGMR